VIMIRDPCGRIDSGAFTEEPSTFQVTEKGSTNVDVQADFSVKLRMKEW